jgi:hypothetical protein
MGKISVREEQVGYDCLDPGRAVFKGDFDPVANRPVEYTNCKRDVSTWLSCPSEE